MDWLIVFVITLGLSTQLTTSEVLNPPYFNIAEGRKIHATETCGEEKVGKEQFCKIIGSMWTETVGYSGGHVVDGQACDDCDSKDPQRAHPAEYAIDGSPKWWQSPPLSRGPEAARVNLTIDLGQEFHVAYVYITMANSPRPGVWVLERSTDEGKSFKPWMYFADSREECVKQFGEESVQKLTRDDQVICETKYSKLIPLENGEIAVSLVDKRPSGDNFTSSEVLQEFTKATNVRLRFIRPQTTFGHLFNVDQTVTRRYFYSIRDINIGGRCVCNGHAETCDVTDAENPNKLNCVCQHNTDGDKCQFCKAGYVQKRWRPSTPENPFVCEKCNCNGHSDRCHFEDEVEKQKTSMDIYGQYSGGGVCEHCKNQTTGINCHECKYGFYRPEGRPLNATNVCIKCSCTKPSHAGGCDTGTGTCQCKSNFTNAPACDECAYGYYNEPDCPRCPCYRNGTVGEICDPGTGQCACKDAYSGLDCGSCAPDYWGFPECRRCNCDRAGSDSPNCNTTTGQCSCKKQYDGRQCDYCSIGFYAYPECKSCDCNPLGTTDEICNQANGECKCKPGFDGPRCDKCEPGYYGFPNCTLCGCDAAGSVNQTCNQDGRCTCAPRFGGLKCNLCGAGYYPNPFPKCEPCNCDPAGSYGVTCQNGICQCRDNFEGVKCNKCKKNFYNFPICESCSCNPAGVVPNFPGCSEVISGKLCECKERVIGRYCDTCAPHFKNLRTSNILGCEPCRCNRAGSLNGLDACDGESGQCSCKESVTGLACDRCSSGSYALSVGNYLGCVPCDCDVGGSWRGTCDQRTGACQCRFRIEGRRCDRPQRAHYYYSTYQYLYELEDGRGEYHNIRYDYNETTFPGFSWKGYAKFSDFQKKVIIDFVIVRSSFYRVILHYHNPGSEPISGNLTLSNENEPPQHIKITFPPTTQPKRYLIPMDKTSPLYLFASQRQWKAALSADEPLLVDYIVFLPQAYFEANILKENVTAACTISTANYQLCRHYGYTKFPASAITHPKDETTATGNADAPQDTRDSFLIDATLLSDQDREHVFDLEVDKTQKYVLILSYVYRVTNPPPKGQVAKLTVEVKTINGTVNNPFQVPMCQYTFPCRHAVLNEKAAPFEFHLESGLTSVSVKLNNEIGEATFSILGLVFLPKSDWNTDHVKPSLICIMRNLTCLDMSFDSNPESTKIPFGPKGKVSPVSPNAIEGSDNQDRTVELVGTAPRTENYKLIVHYYQPDHPSFDIELTFLRTPNSPFEQATLHIAHCPSKSGCRAIIKFKKPLGVLEENKEFTLAAIPPKDRGVHFDYLLLNAEKSFSQTQLGLPIVDRSTEFLRHCVQDAFYIDDSSSEFCKQALFTLTTGLNNGGAFCSCNATGSKGFTCNPLGGQCDCKPNVIGRECKACKSDFYGFPDCKPCNCPETAAYCEPVTGECVCPRNVVGANCDECAPGTWGYDPRMGCEPCNCHRTGVKDGNLQCHPQYGHCDCKEKYDGRTCDSCKAGYFEFPVCRVCDCHFDGTTIDICDRKSGNCYCKKNVLKPNCDICRRGTYNLEKNNPKGCTECFCFGTTENCRSSDMRINAIKAANYSDWSVVDITFTDSGMRPSSVNIESSPGETEFKIKPVTVNRGGSGDIPAGSDGQSNIYFKAPNEFLGNCLTSYGGFINFTFIESTDSNLSPSDTPVTPDIVLVGRNHTITLTRDEQPEAPGKSQRMEIELLESKFVHTTDSNPVTRAQFMTLLYDLQAIYIRAAYFSPMDSAILSEFSLDSVSNKPDVSAPLALRVEQCICPPNYRGSSCEECASGYYRVVSGPGLGSCVLCQCNGHSNECDAVTGKCFNCKHNTKGDHCEICQEGHYGNATYGTPHDCLSCPCPLPNNNFAESCEVRVNQRSQSEVFCKCKKGYTGQSCEFCGAGHFGDPMVVGKFCIPCECNNNIDPSDPVSCDLYTGVCTKCLNNTAGKACEYCADNYYGDAITVKDCKPCQCDDYGTKVCDRYTGQCECHPNVIGDSCDQCKPNHYGFSKGKGCIDCNCSIASQGYDCDMETGQCNCQPGATGQICDRCEAGFWQYSESGCKSCGCVEKYSRGAVCNQKTGQCECLPGVVGDKCDKCPWRWVFIHNEGCLECGECQHALLNDTDELERSISGTLNDFSNSSSSVHAKRKFGALNNTVTELYKLLNSVVEASQSIDLSPVEALMTKMTNESDPLQSWQERLTRLAGGVNIKVNETRENAQLVRRLLKKVKAETESLVTQLADVDTLVSRQANDANIQELTLRATDFYDQINRIKFDKFVDLVRNETDNSIAILDQVQDYIAPYINERQSYNESRTQLQKIESLLDEANKKIFYSITTALDVQQGLNNSRKVAKETLVPASTALKNLDTAISDNLKEAKVKLDSSEPIIKDADISFNSLVEISSGLGGKKDNLRDRMFEPEKLSEPEFQDLVRRAAEHSYTLSRTASDLEALFLETIRKSDINRFMKAATAYETIEKAIGAAETHSADAIDKITGASWQGLPDKVTESGSASAGNRTEADSLRANILTKGTQLAKYNETMKSLSLVSGQQGEQLKKIDDDLETIEGASKAEQSREVQSIAELGVEQANAVSGRVDGLLEQITSLRNVTKQLFTEGDSSFTNFHESDSFTKFYDNQGITQKIQNATDKINRMVNLIDSSKGKLKDLQTHISKARDLANRIDIAMKIDSGASIQLRRPEALESSGSYNKLSLYFSTLENDGLLAFVGNARPTLTRSERAVDTTDDYMAVLIRSGKIRVVLDLGSGPQSLETDTKVNDGRWINLIVERIGKTLKITINKDNKEIVTHGHIDGYTSVLDLNSARSHIFLGSIPSNYVVPDTIPVNSYSGSVAHITLGDSPLGLLNYEKGVYVSGDYIPNQPPIKGMHFTGRGLASAVTDPSKLTVATPIEVIVKTYARNGLILLLTGATDYLAIQLDDGRPKAIIDLGSGYVSITHQDRINDGNEHAILFDRFYKDITLGVRGRDTVKAQTSGSQTTLELDPTFYIGGQPSKFSFPEVSTTPFEGCIGDLTVDAKLVALSNTTMTPGVLPSCPDSGVREATFDPRQPGYIEMPLSLEIIESVQISFKFRTNNSLGLLFFAANTETPPKSSIMIYLEEGSLAFKTDPGHVIKSAGIRYDDNEWHYVMVTKNSAALRMDIDDKTEVDLTVDDPKSLNIPAVSYYLGGAPKDYESVLTEAGVSQSFFGCIGDAVIHDKFQDLRKATNIKGATLVTCKAVSDGKPKVKPVEVTTLAPVTTPKPIIKSLCALPYESYDPNMTIASHGRRFYASEHSRVEIKLSNDQISSLVTKATLSLEFRTLPIYTGERLQGIMFVLADPQYVDLFVLYMYDGIVYFAWNLGGGMTTARPEKWVRFDDDKWHKVTVSLNLREGKIIYPDGHIAIGQSSGTSTNLNVVSPAYLGGLPKSGTDRIKSLIRGISNSFPGCIRNVVLNDVKVDLEDRSVAVGNKFFKAPTCSDKIEGGMYFTGQNSFLSCYDGFKVGSNLDLVFYIKPRNNTGLLAAFFGKPNEKGKYTDYLIVKMVEGKLYATLNNGAGGRESWKFLDSDLKICDGKWHKINVWKVHNAHFINVDDGGNFATFTVPGVNVADTTSPMYLADVPEVYRKAFPDLPPPYIGCIKDVSYIRPTAMESGQRTEVNLVDDCKESDNTIYLCPSI